MISNIISKEFLTTDSAINIVYVKNTNEDFDIFLKELFPNGSIIDFYKTFYGINNPNIIISNSRTSEDIKKCTELCEFFHIPLILIYDNANQYEPLTVNINFAPCYKISLSTTNNSILLNKFNKIMLFDIYDKKNIMLWRNLILEICKQPFLFSEQQ